MKRLILPLVLFALSACATAPVLDVAAAPKGAYVLDPAHASVNWSLSHSGLSFYTARFDDITGALDFNPILIGTINLQRRRSISTETHIVKFVLYRHRPAKPQTTQVRSRAI